MNADKKIQEKLNEHKWYHRMTAITLVLSLLCAFLIPLDLIQPGFAETSGWDGEYSDTPADTIPAGATNVYSALTKVVSSPEVLYGGSSSQVIAKFYLDYNFDSGSGVSTTQPYVYYDLPANLIAKEDLCGSDRYSTDTSDTWKEWYNKKYPDAESVPTKIGYYTICKKSTTGKSLLVLKFTDDYAEYVASNNGQLKGSVTFDGVIDRAQTEDGTQTVYFNNDIVKNVTFDNKVLSVSKSANKLSADNETPKIEWTITVNNPDGFFNPAGYYLEDTDMERAINGFTVSPAGTGSYNATEKRFYLSGTPDEDGKYPTSFTITYQTYSTLEDIQNKKDTNTAFLKNKNDSTYQKTSSEEVSLSYGANAVLTKSGEPSYTIDGSTGTNGYIEWTIRLTRPYGLSLENYVITDSAWNGTYTDFTCTGGTVTGPVNGAVTVTSASADGLTITYRVPKDNTWNDSSVYSGYMHENPVSVTPPDGDPPPVVPDTPTTKYDDSDLAKVQKTGDFDPETNTITWRIEVAAYYNNNAKPISNYIIEDDAFANLSDSLSEISVFMALRNYSIVDSSAVSFERVSGTTNQIKINSTEANWVIFQYTVHLTEAEIEQFTKTDNSESEHYAVNTVKLKDPDNPSADDTTEGKSNNPIYLTDSMTKTLEENEKSFELTGTQDGDETSRTLHWKTSFEYYGTLGTDVTAVVDQVSADHNGVHYISADNLDSIVLKARSKKTDTPITLIKGTHYTVTAESTNNSDKNDKFTITFTEQAAPYHFVDIEYNTTADFENVGENGTETSTFSNTASGIGTGAADQFTFTRKDPEDVPEIEITANKQWQEDGGDHHVPVTVHLERKTGENGTFAPYPNADNPYTAELNGTNNWSCVWSNLPEHTPDRAKTLYYYRIVEDTDVSGYSKSYSSNNTDGINETGTLTAINTYTKVCITAKKNWTDETTDSVTVQLQRRTNAQSNWQNVGEAQTLSTENSWQYTWHDQEKGYEYQVVEANVKNGYRVSYSGTLQNTGTITITNEPDVLSIRTWKNWTSENGYTEDRKPVTLTLQQKIGDGEWTDHKSDTVTSENWSKQIIWADLPAHDYENNQPTVPVYYRVVEKTENVPEGYIASYNEEGVNYSADLPVTNTYDRLHITGHKEWKNDNSTTEDRPGSIDFILERRPVRSTVWEKVGQQTVTADQNYYYADFSWDGLDKKNEAGYTYTYRVREAVIPDGYLEEYLSLCQQTVRLTIHCI